LTRFAYERNWSFWGFIYSKARNCLSIDRAEKAGVHRAEKLVYVKQNSPNTAILPSDGAKHE
jgi:hypothetical protein